MSSCAAHALVLQLPLEGTLQGGGVSAVLKRPEGAHPMWLTQGHKRNFFISFAEVLPSEALWASQTCRKGHLHAKDGCCCNHGKSEMPMGELQMFSKGITGSVADLFSWSIRHPEI